MGNFADDLARFSAKVETKSRAAFVNVCAAAKQSITDGSPLTGAPGQPVQTGNLKASWQLELDSPTSATISTNVVYARAIEDGASVHGPLTLRSSVGGFHSVALTMAGLPRIVEAETKAVSRD